MAPRSTYVRSPAAQAGGGCGKNLRATSLGPPESFAVVLPLIAAFDCIRPHRIALGCSTVANRWSRMIAPPAVLKPLLTRALRHLIASHCIRLHLRTPKATGRTRTDDLWFTKPLRTGRAIAARSYRHISYGSSTDGD